ncbi:hypothetical protein J1605_019526 [Eschrichtius robustus]|uniref:Ig-like domain-containing protein n=1 Tax=Eschrichtius robustus TaxID=9764 RepID=A0AB34HLZ6_ESCRO|nr:hypothetical protein J1605_019526 [Eschrichtius robustus]
MVVLFIQLGCGHSAYGKIGRGPVEELSVTWKRNGVRVTSGLHSFGRRLTVSTPTSSDVGEYVCEAALPGSAFEPATAKAFLSIIGSPAILCFSAHHLSFTGAERVPGTQREHQPGWDEDELDASPPLKEFRGPEVYVSPHGSRPPKAATKAPAGLGSSPEAPGGSTSRLTHGLQNPVHAVVGLGLFPFWLLEGLSQVLETTGIPGYGHLRLQSQQLAESSSHRGSLTPPPAVTPAASWRKFSAFKGPCDEIGPAQLL